MKAHIGVDFESGAIHSFEATSANVHDRKVMDKLFHGKEKAKFGDKGYFDENEKRKARAKGIFYGILDKAKRGKKLSNKQKKRNKKLSSIRAKVEHPFRILKCQFKYTKTRYKGLFKNKMQLFSLFALANLYKFRKKLISNNV